MTASPRRSRRMSAMGDRRRLVELRFTVEERLSTARTVGDVWRINDHLARLDAQIEAS